MSGRRRGEKRHHGLARTVPVEVAERLAIAQPTCFSEQHVARTHLQHPAHTLLRERQKRKRSKAMVEQGEGDTTHTRLGGDSSSD